jgi:phosphorylase/glycogen(starch) synthase
MMQSIYKEYFGDEFTITNRYDAKCWQQIYRVSDNELWQARLKQKNDLMDEIRRRVSDPSQFRFDSP